MLVEFNLIGQKKPILFKVTGATRSAISIGFQLEFLFLTFDWISIGNPNSSLEIVRKESISRGPSRNLTVSDAPNTVRFRQEPREIDSFRTTWNWISNSTRLFEIPGFSHPIFSFEDLLVCREEGGHGHWCRSLAEGAGHSARCGIACCTAVCACQAAGTIRCPGLSLSLSLLSLISSHTYTDTHTYVYAYSVHPHTDTHTHTHTHTHTRIRIHTYMCRTAMSDDTTAPAGMVQFGTH